MARLLIAAALVIDVALGVYLSATGRLHAPYFLTFLGFLPALIMGGRMGGLGGGRSPRQPGHSAN